MLDEAFPSQSSVASKRMNSARQNKYDEYYTSYEDAEKLLLPFKKHLRGKRILMPCDNPDKSEMFKWVFDNFELLGLESLSCTGFGCSDMLVMNSPDDYDMISIQNNGDFTRGESLEAMDACDVVIGNPPFSQNLGPTFLTLPLEKGKDVIGIEQVEKCTYGKLKEAILNKKLTVYKCPYENFNVPVDSQGAKATNDTGNYIKMSVQVYAFSSFNDVHELKEKLAPYFKRAMDIGVRWDDLPDLPSGPRQDRVDIKVLYDYDTGSHVNFSWIPPKPKADGITMPKLAISTYHILGCNWERYFNIEQVVKNNKVTLLNPRTGDPLKTISSTYFVFSYK